MAISRSPLAVRSAEAVDEAPRPFKVSHLRLPSEALDGINCFFIKRLQNVGLSCLGLLSCGELIQ
jgi:hypothetical protein